jgi:hypothetical protein
MTNITTSTRTDGSGIAHHRRSPPSAGQPSAADSGGCNTRTHHPLLYHLRNVECGVLGAVTWARECRRWDSPRASQGREQDFRGVLHRVCVNLRLRDKDIRIYRATEFGNAGKCHFHFLVAKEGLRHVSPAQFAAEFTRQWCKEFRPYDSKTGGVGTAVVVPYDESYGSSGVDYCSKREYDERGRQQERDDYVSRKLFNVIRRFADGQPPLDPRRGKYVLNAT